MKKNGYKVIAALTAAAAAAALVLGCGSGSGSASSGSSQSAETSQAAAGTDTGTAAAAEDAGEGASAADAGAAVSAGADSADADAGAAGTGERKVIKAVTKGVPSPYMTVDENNELSGSDIEIIKAVFDRLPQYELEIVLSDDPLTGILSGLYDIGVNNYAYREERADSYYFSYPYKRYFDVYIQRADDEPITGLQDIADRGYKIEVGAGTDKANSLEAWNAENPDHQIDMVYIETDFALKFQHLMDGISDVAIDDGPIFDTLIPDFGLEGKLVANPIDEETQKYISPYTSTYFLFAKDEAGAALREDVNRAILEIREDGTLSEILVRYFGKDTTPDDSYYESTIN